MLNLNENKLKKEIKNVSNDHNIKVLFRSENNDVWSKTVCSSELEEVFYTNEFLNYQISYKRSFKKKAYDFSFIVLVDNFPEAVFPIFVYEDKITKIGYLTENLIPPLFQKDTNNKTKNNIYNFLFDLISKIKKEIKFDNVFFFEISPEDKILSSFRKFLSNKKYLQLDSPDLYLNLQTKINTIQKNIRRRYFDSIKKGTNFELIIFDPAKFDKIFWKDFQLLHLREAKRKTRSDQSWDIQYDNLIKNKSIFIFALENNEVIAGSYFDISKDYASYSVGVYNLQAKKNNLSRHMQYKAILEFKKREIKWYYLGKFYDEKMGRNITKKDISISFFKKGFASDLVKNNQFKIII